MVSTVPPDSIVKVKMLFYDLIGCAPNVIMLPVVMSITSPATHVCRSVRFVVIGSAGSLSELKLQEFTAKVELGIVKTIPIPNNRYIQKRFSKVSPLKHNFRSFFQQCLRSHSEHNT